MIPVITVCICVFIFTCSFDSYRSDEYRKEDLEEAPKNVEFQLNITNTTTSARPKDPLMHQLYYNPNNGYEAYWQDGEWHIRDEAEWDFKEGPPTTPVPTVCGDECPYLYTRIGAVCARAPINRTFNPCNYTICGKEEYRVGWYPKEYQTFKSYCNFLDAKCRDLKHYTKYSYVHLGKCFKEEYHTKMYPPNSAFNHSSHRIIAYLDDYHQNFRPLKYLPSEMKTTTARPRLGPE